MRRLFPLALLVSCTPSTSEQTEAAPASEPAAPSTEPAAPTRPPVETPPVEPPSVEPPPVEAPPVEPLPNTPKIHVDFSKLHTLSVQEGHFTIETLNYPASKGFEALAEEYDGYADGLERKLPESHRGLPKGFRVGQTVSVVTRDGVTESKVEGLGLMAGGSELQLRVVLGEGPEGARGFALAKGSFHPGAVVREPKALPVSGESLEALAKRVTDLASPSAKKLLARYPLDEGESTSVRPHLPPDAEQLLVVGVSIDPQEPTEPMISALLVLDRDGSLHAIEPVENRLESFAIAYTADLDGDGIDEILYTSEYYEGAYEHLLRWNGKAWKTTLLAGDGA